MREELPGEGLTRRTSATTFSPEGVAGPGRAKMIDRSQRSQGRELLKSYLLGVASAGEREAVEDEYLSDKRSAKRLLRAEDDLIEDYVRGALTRHERALFEKNFLCTAERRRRRRTPSAPERSRASGAARRCRGNSSRRGRARARSAPRARSLR